MPKDRLAELKAKNGEGSQEEKDGLMLGSDKNDDKSRQCFLKLSQQTMAIQENLQQNREKVSQIKSLHNTILSSPKYDPNVKQMMEKLTQSITKDMGKICKDLKGVNKSAAEDRRKKQLSDTEFRMICTVHSALTTKFQEIWEELSNARNDYESRCKQRIQRQLQIAGYVMTNEETDEAMISGVPIFSKDFAECESAKLALRDLEDRHQELLDLEKGITEMHDMFLELSIMIESQGEIIDKIEFDVVDATDKVTAGTGQLAEAKQKKQAYTKKKIICISVSVTVAVIVTIIIILTTIYS